MEKEIWKEIQNFKNIVNNTYLISNFGNIKYKRNDQFMHKKIANRKNHPYYAVYLKKNNGKSEWVLVHQLVAYFFIEIPIDLKNRSDIVPDHLDNNGLNNNYLNLEWKTRAQNVSDAFKMGYINNSGEHHKDVFINEREAYDICKYLESGLSYDLILNIMEFPNNKKYRTLLVRIKNGLSWKQVSKKFNIPKDIKYSKYQKDTVDKIPYIINMINDGKSNREICDELYSDNDRKNKMRIIQNIRKRKIYKNLLSDMK